MINLDYELSRKDNTFVLLFLIMILIAAISPFAFSTALHYNQQTQIKYMEKRIAALEQISMPNNHFTTNNIEAKQ